MKQFSKDSTAPTGAGGPIIQVEALSKDFAGVPAVTSVDLTIKRGELFAILGSSGCGKSTLLRMLAGFERPSSGRILIDGVDVTALPPYERPVNLMFQSYAVFPHMSVENNVAYGLKKEGLPAAEIQHRVDEMLHMVKLGGFAKRKPQTLSGGQLQRVALARALVKKPKVLLLDEPLAALDKKLREQTQFELMNIQYNTGITFVVVTHDQEEAMTLATRIAVMEAGRFVQIGTPNEVYEFPTTRFVADFVGTINMFECRLDHVDSDRMRLNCAETHTSFEASATPQPPGAGPLWLAVRPEKINISKTDPSATGCNVLKGVVWDLAYYGNHSIYLVKTESGKIIHVSAQNRLRSAQRVLEWDEHVYLSWDRASSVVLVQ